MVVNIFVNLFFFFNVSFFFPTTDGGWGEVRRNLSSVLLETAETLIREILIPRDSLKVYSCISRKEFLGLLFFVVILRCV